MPIIPDSHRVEIWKKTKDYSRRKTVLFSFLCAARALPFLGATDDLTAIFGEKANVYLHSILNAIDITAYCIWNTPDFSIIQATINEVSRVSRVCANVDKTTETAYDVLRTIDYVVSAISYAVNATVNMENALAATDDVANAAYYATLAAHSATATPRKMRSKLEKIQKSDTIAIDANNLISLDNDISVYGKIWESFISLLRRHGCGYWAKIYDNLFKSRFEVDFNELERRLFKVPDEIVERGADAVGRYLENLGDKVERLNEARIIILGEKGAGKTSLARKLVNINAKMPEEEESTEGVDTFIWSFPDKDGNDMNAHIWDFAGHSITHSAHRCFMSARCLYIYVYNGRIENDNDPAYWLEQIRIHGGISPVLFLINERDDHEADIAEKTLKIDYPSIVGYYRVDIGNNDKTELEKFRQTAMNMVRDNPSWNRQIISSEAYRIKRDLRMLFDSSKSPHITRDEFDEIARNYNVTNERIEEILDDLHTLGICLWYNRDEMEEFNMLVLNPDWITNGIYRIISKGYKERKHILTVSSGVEILSDDERYRYPRDKVSFLYKLMRVYELAFFKDSSHVFIPGILTLDRPDKLPTFDDVNDRLTMVLSVEKALPPNIVARVIVQRSEFGEIFDERLLWRKGAVLKYSLGVATALVVEDERSVTVRVKGTDKTAYIASLRGTLKDVFESYKAIKPDLLYEVLVPEEKRIATLYGNEISLMLPEEVISGHLQMSRPFFDAQNKRDIPLNKTGMHYEIVNFGNIFIDSDDYSTHTSIEIRDCVINFQGELNALAKDFRSKSFDVDADYVEDIVNTVEESQRVVSNTSAAELESVLTKKGLASKLLGFYNELTDEHSELYKKTIKLRNGSRKLQNIMKVYNELAKLIPILPQVPEVILSFGKSNKND